MSPRHHPIEELLLDYATGALNPAGRDVIACHLGACPTCDRTVASVENVGGLLLSNLPDAKLHGDALGLALARIERNGPSRTFSLPARPDWIAVPYQVLQAAQERRRWAAPGVWVATVATESNGARTYLLGVGAGMSVPLHTHRGSEMICVLRGAYLDGETLHGPGDFACNDESVRHRPVITADGDCVCLVSADDALVPLDWVGRLFQPLVGI